MYSTEAVQAVATPNETECRPITDQVSYWMRGFALDGAIQWHSKIVREEDVKMYIAFSFCEAVLNNGPAHETFRHYTYWFYCALADLCMNRSGSVPSGKIGGHCEADYRRFAEFHAPSNVPLADKPIYETRWPL